MKTTDILYSCFLVGLILATCIQAECPENYQDDIEKCMAGVTITPQMGGAVTSLTDVDEIKRLCVQGIWQKTIQCLSDMYHHCKDNPTILNNMDKLFSIARWQEGAELLCKNVNKIVYQKKCLSIARDDVMECTLRYANTFSSGIQSLTPNSPVIYKLLEACRFAEGSLECMSEPLSRSCPPQIKHILLSTMSRFLPPICDHVDKYGRFIQGQSRTEDVEVTD
ncbi:hypothetical protein SNE40_015591 [Patella caerulea]|uniref:Uncharacterized protein n=1 Tax=Patella caerulea TaxID=87958 RepID=A0AAN8JK93_PATCE